MPSLRSVSDRYDPRAIPDGMGDFFTAAATAKKPSNTGEPVGTVEDGLLQYMRNLRGVNANSGMRHATRMPSF